MFESYDQDIRMLINEILKKLVYYVNSNLGSLILQVNNGQYY